MLRGRQRTDTALAGGKAKRVNVSFAVPSDAGLISDRLRAAVLAQEPDRVFKNWQGVMIGDGSNNMWARDARAGEATRYGIVMINASN